MADKKTKKLMETLEKEKMKTFKQYMDELNAGPSTPVTRVGNGFLPNLGAGRLNDKKIRLKTNPMAGLPKV